jgi:hypothetical protein
MTDKYQEIVDSRDWDRMVSFGQYPSPGEYVLTGAQVGNLRGEHGWDMYIGYVVQIRKQAGAFGSDMVLLRHPDGQLRRHENQFFFGLDDYWTAKAKSVFDDGIDPSMEDYSQPYTLDNGEYPAVGAIVEPEIPGPKPDNSPLVKITISRPDGSKIVEVC